MDKRLERILPRVQKPARYVGGEYNAILKDKAAGRHPHRLLLPGYLRDRYVQPGYAYPLRRNEQYAPASGASACSLPGATWRPSCVRRICPFLPWNPATPSRDYDIVAFSVGYEMAFPAILNMLDLAGIPLHAADRTGLTPLVIAGGTAMYNAEPLADFIDLVSLGEGEDVTVELVELHRRARREGWSKADFLRAAAQTGRYLCARPFTM